MTEYNAIAILGPTASGKSELAFRLASKLNAEIVSCDSVQIYKGFDIGSAKASVEERALVIHHMIDVLNADSKMDAATYAEQAQACIEDIFNRGKVPIVVGGTGLYFRALQKDRFHTLPSDASLKAQLSQISTDELRSELEEVDPERASQVHPNDRVRILRGVEIFRLSRKTIRELTEELDGQINEMQKTRFMVKCLNPARAVLHERIAKRACWMVENGLVDEVERLLASGVSRDSWPFQSIGYKQVLEWIDNSNASKQDLIEKITIATRQYAKRQCTWFREVDKVQVDEKDLNEIVNHLLLEFKNDI